MTLNVQRILCPTDFSEPSNEALELAIEMARRFDAELVLFHAHEMPAYVFPDSVMPAAPTVLQQLEAAADAELRRASARVREAGVPVRIASAMGAQDLEICRYAEEMHADLIIMGTHGRTGIRHALLGSIAEKVVRRAPCPVLTVRPRHGQGASAHASQR
jgi:universal stress protein A